MTDEGLALGDAYERTLKAVNDHIGDCSVCAWLGDHCEEREKRMEALILARINWNYYTHVRPKDRPKDSSRTRSTMYFIHELNDQGDVIDTYPFTDRDDRELQMFSCKNILRSKGRKFRVERATLNADGKVVNKEDVT